MRDLTVLCDECGEEVDGAVAAIEDSDPDGGAILMTAGFHLFDFGVSCDDCVGGVDDSENAPSDSVSISGVDDV